MHPRFPRESISSKSANRKIGFTIGEATFPYENRHLHKELATLKQELSTLGQNQQSLHRSFHDFNQSFLQLQEHLNHLESKTGERLANLTHRTEQVQKAIPNPAAFPLKLFLSGDLVTYRGILGVLAFSSLLVSGMVAILIHFMPIHQQLQHSEETQQLDKLNRGNKPK